MRRKFNSDLHLYQHLRTIDYNVQCHLYSNSTCNGSINLSCQSYRSSLSDTISDQYSICSMACNCKWQRWMQRIID